MINTITTVLEALTTFPDRPNYTSSSAYGAAVAQWLKENKELSETFAILIPELNTMINQINLTSESLNTIDEDVIQNKEDIEAIAVAVEALKDETILIKNLAEKWANENENVVVENGKYSAMHWALKAYAAVATLPEGTLLDTVTAINKTWSSSKIKEELDNKTQIIKPSITFPTNGTVDFTGAITFSAFQASSNYKGVQDYIECVVATDAAFTNIIDSYISDVGFLSWTPSISLPLTVVYIKYRTGSDNHLSQWCETVSVTTINQGINAPTITSPLNLAVDLGKNVTITKSSFSPFGGLSEPLFSVSWQMATDAAFANIVSESLNDTINKTSWTSGNLAVSTTYYARVKDETENYESTYSNAITFTTKAQFTPTIGTQGEWGFGIAPTDEPFAALGLAEMTGTNTVGHANYGNYIHTNGSIVCWNVKGFYRIGHASSPRYAVYGANAIDMVGTETFENETEANTGGYVLHRVFINNGAEKSGYFQDKYMNSKDGTTAGKSVFGGNPIGMTTNATYNPSSTMTGCTGILADAVTLSRARGTRWNCSSAFMYAWAAMVSVAHGQAATSTANCAWYDATLTTNFPKGCNNGALSDTNDATVVYAASPDNAAKPLTGATSNFNKTTHNGCANGIADLNGGLFEVPIGITNYGTSATDTTAYSNDTIYVLKTTVDHASLTGGWNGATDAWGAAATLASRFDAVTSPHPIGSSAGAVYWGNGTNAVFSADASGVNRNLCGFIPKDSSASNATGINMLGNDYFNKYGRANQVPLCCGNWNNAASAGLFCRNFVSSRSHDYNNASFRASAYFG